jgi:transcription elongation factor Elf1
MAVKKPRTIDEIVEILPEDHPVYQNIVDILTLIKDGAKWDSIKDRFVGVPDSIHVSKDKGSITWLPRYLQVEIGKIKPIEAVQVSPPGPKRKAIYEEVGKYIAKHGDNGDLPSTVKAFDIECACGTRFIGREPEHQIRCPVCKMKKKVTVSNVDKQALRDQADSMIKILGRKRLNKVVRCGSEQALITVLRKAGLSDVDIYNAFHDIGYVTDNIKNILNVNEDA